MRIGINPNKDKVIDTNDFFHQVIIPVYIPNQDGYFKESFKILKYCLQSLFKTSHDKTYFTVVNNGSDVIVRDYLNDLLFKGLIHELIHTDNIGKLNAILKGLTGQNFKLVTISDSDVLFLNDWQKATYSIYETFPKAGAVCPTPSSKSFNDKTFNLLFDNFFSRRLYFSNVKNTEALKAFAQSVGNPMFYNNTHLEKYLVIEKRTIKAVVGAGHFVATYRFDVFNNLGISFSEFVLGGDSENKILDLPIIEKGLWRLSTEDNYAYHMGNVEETWMKDVLNSLSFKRNHSIANVHINIGNFKESKVLFFFKNVLLAKIFYKKKFRQWFLHYKGLTKEEAKEY